MPKFYILYMHIYGFSLTNNFRDTSPKIQPLIVERKKMNSSEHSGHSGNNIDGFTYGVLFSVGASFLLIILITFAVCLHPLASKLSDKLFTLSYFILFIFLVSNRLDTMYLRILLCCASCWLKVNFLICGHQQSKLFYIYNIYILRNLETKAKTNRENEICQMMYV